MLKKLLVALVASAFALGAYAQAPSADSKGQGEVKAEKKAKSTKAKPAKKAKTDKTDKAKSEDAKK
ncbi:MAG TPA: hypothetical protein VIQ55_08955 [Burkholderiales bacterium]|jgi:hypothetical protein